MGEVYWLEGLWPAADPMLHTALPEAPIQHEWLFGVSVYALERALGFYGLRVVHTIAVALIIWLVFSMFRLAAILAGVLRRGLDGNASDASAIERGRAFSLFAESALDVVS